MILFASIVYAVGWGIFVSHSASIWFRWSVGGPHSFIWRSHSQHWWAYLSISQVTIFEPNPNRHQYSSFGYPRLLAAVLVQSQVMEMSTLRSEQNHERNRWGRILNRAFS